MSRSLGLSDDEKRERARQRARDWYEVNKERAKANALAYYHAKPKKGRPKGPSHVLWKGDDVAYHTLHAWVDREKGKPSACEHCGRTDAKRYEWANVDHKYRRVLADWVRLCTACHRKHDYKHGLSNVGSRWGSKPRDSG